MSLWFGTASAETPVKEKPSPDTLCGVTIGDPMPKDLLVTSDGIFWKNSSLVGQSGKLIFIPCNGRVSGLAFVFNILEIAVEPLVSGLDKSGWSPGKTEKTSTGHVLSWSKDGNTRLMQTSEGQLMLALQQTTVCMEGL
tara:strand:- start:696 stop:1112 length:417 start_codon:yes stop_codon:yes gene_type:complete